MITMVVVVALARWSVHLLVVNQLFNFSFVGTLNQTTVHAHFN